MKCRQPHKRRKVRNAAALLKHVAKCEKANEFAHDQTRQRRFERRFESRDLPDSRAARADATDGGRSAAAIRSFETRCDKRWYEERVRSAAARLTGPLACLRGLLWAIYRNGRRRKISLREIGKTEGWYRWGLKKLLNFFCPQ